MLSIVSNNFHLKLANLDLFNLNVSFELNDSGLVIYVKYSRDLNIILVFLDKEFYIKILNNEFLLLRGSFVKILAFLIYSKYFNNNLDLSYLRYLLNFNKVFDVESDKLIISKVDNDKVLSNIDLSLKISNFNDFVFNLDLDIDFDSREFDRLYEFLKDKNINISLFNEDNYITFIIEYLIKISFNKERLFNG